jgi:Predicted hydrolases or acyltransferases (alpha/beta hydrolase superfamily)
MARLCDSFTVLAPDQRGYNLTTRPAETSDYCPAHLVADAAALIAGLGDEPVCLVAHDWGATIAFWLAIEHPHLVRCLTILNGAHPYLLQDAIWDDPGQRAASQYFKLLRTPDFEKRVLADSGASLAEAWFGDEVASGRMSRTSLDLRALKPGAGPAPGPRC